MLGPGRQAIWAAILLASALLGPAEDGRAAEPLVVRYEAFAAGFPVARFEFELDEGGGAYAVRGQIRTEGLLRLFYGVSLSAESEGRAAAEVAPRVHEHVLRNGSKERLAHLDYAGDGTVAARLVPAEDSGRPKPSPQQVRNTIDPLSAVLALGRAAARAGACTGSFAVFDGRRRYDVVLTDEGGDRIEPSPAYGYAGPARRCRASAVKIAGFSFDQDYAPHATSAQVWLAPPRAGAPALPIRIEFDSSWGFVEVRMTKVGN